MAAYPTPESAELAFYQAFAHGDLEGMMDVWATDARVVCVHPLGTRLEGLEHIRQSWKNLFDHSPKMSFRVGEAYLMHEQELAVHLVHEHIRIADNADFQAPVIATNVYRLLGDSWRMVLHHASPTPQRKPERPSGTTVH